MFQTCSYTYFKASVLLIRKARRLRRETRNSSYVAKEELGSISMSKNIQGSLFRPLKMLFTEPLLFIFCVCLILGVIYSFTMRPIGLDDLRVSRYIISNWQTLTLSLSRWGIRVSSCICCYTLSFQAHSLPDVRSHPNCIHPTVPF